MIDTIYSDPNVLCHHGIKGMKWGIRHDPKPVNRTLRYTNGEYKRIAASTNKKIKRSLAEINTNPKYTRAQKRNLSNIVSAQERERAYNELASTTTRSGNGKCFAANTLAAVGGFTAGGLMNVASSQLDGGAATVALLLGSTAAGIGTANALAAYDAYEVSRRQKRSKIAK